MSRFVYLIRHGDSHKIGVSGNPSRRKQLVAPSSAGPSEVVHQFPSEDAFRIENALHHYFAGKCLGGEWFSLSEDDVALIRSIPSADSVHELPDRIRTALPNYRDRLFVPMELHDLVAELARRNHRPVAWQHRIIIQQALVDAGLLKPEDATFLEPEEEEK